MDIRNYFIVEEFRIKGFCFFGDSGVGAGE